MTTEQEVTDNQRRFADDLDAVIGEIRTMLIAKNNAYGDAALDPVRIFSKANALEQIDVRIDDKLSRIVRGQSAGEDVFFDLVGYLLIRRVAQTRLLKHDYNPT
ncbi:MAG: hypothetical protein ACYDG4_14665 [Desulfuromonadaceae bacterium]